MIRKFLKAKIKYLAGVDLSLWLIFCALAVPRVKVLQKKKKKSIS